jgi:hypothetical protein
MQTTPPGNDAGLHVIFSPTGVIWLAPSRTAALQRAYNLSAKATSLEEAPMCIVDCRADERLNAYAIFAEWDARGWPRPTPANLNGLGS